MVIRLPVTRDYYIEDVHGFRKRPCDKLNRKAAPAMVSLLMGSVMALLFYMFNVENFWLPVICGAMAAG